jgi:hypothetical protein
MRHAARTTALAVLALVTGTVATHAQPTQRPTPRRARATCSISTFHPRPPARRRS